jgi:hypothetical protein
MTSKYKANSCLRQGHCSTLSGDAAIYPVLAVFDELNAARAICATCFNAFLSDLSLAIDLMP